jgi:hypothetical protein
VDALEARSLLEGADYDPDTLKVMQQAFDQAWAVITLRVDVSATPQNCRSSLAHAVLAHARVHGRDLDALRNAALASILPALKISN